MLHFERGPVQINEELLSSIDFYVRATLGDREPPADVDYTSFISDLIRITDKSIDKQNIDILGLVTDTDSYKELISKLNVRSFMTPVMGLIRKSRRIRESGQ